MVLITAIPLWLINPKYKIVKAQWPIVFVSWSIFIVVFFYSVNPSLFGDAISKQNNGQDAADVVKYIDLELSKGRNSVVKDMFIDNSHIYNGWEYSIKKVGIRGYDNHTLTDNNSNSVILNSWESKYFNNKKLTEPNVKSIKYPYTQDALDPEMKYPILVQDNYVVYDVSNIPKNQTFQFGADFYIQDSVNSEKDEELCLVIDFIYPENTQKGYQKTECFLDYAQKSPKPSILDRDSLVLHSNIKSRELFFSFEKFDSENIQIKVSLNPDNNLSSDAYWTLYNPKFSSTSEVRANESKRFCLESSSQSSLGLKYSILHSSNDDKYNENKIMKDDCSEMY